MFDFKVGERTFRVTASLPHRPAAINSNGSSAPIRPSNSPAGAGVTEQIEQLLGLNYGHFTRRSPPAGKVR